MPRSVKLHPDYKEIVRLALERNGFLTQGQFAGNLGIALSTVSNFFNCVPISVAKFEEICDALDLDPQIIIKPNCATPIISDCTTSPIINESYFVPNLYSKDTWVGREEIVSDLLVKLQGKTRLVWITGMSGIGKTTLGECVASRVWEDDLSFQWIYLEILEGRNQDFGSVAVEILAKMGDIDLDPQLRNNSEQIAQRLIQKLKFSAYWIQMDSLESLLNLEQPTEFVDTYWAVFFQRCLTESSFSSRLVLTSQVFPIALTEFSDRYPKTWLECRLDGLSSEAQQLDFFAKRGVDLSDHDIFLRIAQTYEGHPLVLKVIAEDILQNFEGDVANYWQEYQCEFEGVGRELQASRLDKTEYNELLDRKVRERLKKSLSRLPTDALDLLCRSAVFRRPVRKDFWMGMIGDRSLQTQEIAYRVLRDYALIEKEGRAIRQHNLIRDLAYNLLKADAEVWKTAERQAANLWLTVYQPAEDDSNLEKVRGYLEAFDHYCEIEDWNIAKDVLLKSLDCFGRKDILRQLLDWSLYQEGIRISLRILKRSTLDAEVVFLKMLGNNYLSLGDYPIAIDYYKKSLAIARYLGDRQSEGNALGNLGLAYYYLGQYDLAIDFHQQYLAIAQELGDRRGEGNALGNLGNGYYSLGEYDRAINFHQQCLNMAQELGNRRSEANSLGNLGNAYYSLGQHDCAIEFLEQQLIIAREIGDRRGEGIALVNMGATQTKLEQYPEALTNNRSALEIFREIGDRPNEAEALKNLAEMYQAQGELEEARDYCQQALVLATELGIPLTAECEVLLLKINQIDKDGAI